MTPCPSWCTTPAHRLLDTLGLPTREDLDLAAYEPHEGALRGPSNSPVAELVLFAEPHGTSGVALRIAGELVLTLPLPDAARSLETLSDALRGAAEDLTVAMAGAR
jgi:hypothetical protein